MTPGAEEGSVYADPERLQKLYGRVPEGTVNPTAIYYDQTDIFRLQMAAVEAGYSNIILMVFDGMDWQTTRAAALYQQPGVPYTSGRGTGLSILDDRRVETDYALVCTSPKLAGAKFDVNAQTVIARVRIRRAVTTGIAVARRRGWNRVIATTCLGSIASNRTR